MEIQEIKTRLSIATVLHRYNLQPDKHNKINCPFHEDKSPQIAVECSRTDRRNIRYVELFR
jgi:DNA primase